MNGWVRISLAALYALIGAGAGAAGGFALDYYVVQLSDQEMRTIATGVQFEGFVTDGVGMYGVWTPSFDRGWLGMDFASDHVVSADVIGDELIAQGWQVDTVEQEPNGVSIDAHVRGVDLDASVRDSLDGGTELSVFLNRGHTSPSSSATRNTATVVGASIGGLGAWWLTGRRQARRRTRPRSTRPVGALK